MNSRDNQLAYISQDDDGQRKRGSELGGRRAGRGHVIAGYFSQSTRTENQLMRRNTEDFGENCISSCNRLNWLRKRLGQEGVVYLCELIFGVTLREERITKSLKLMIKNYEISAKVDHLIQET